MYSGRFTTCSTVFQGKDFAQRVFYDEVTRVNKVFLINKTRNRH